MSDPLQPRRQVRQRLTEEQVGNTTQSDGSVYDCLTHSPPWLAVSTHAVASTPRGAENNP